jgi:hypothetical protein
VVQGYVKDHGYVRRYGPRGYGPRLQYAPLPAEDYYVLHGKGFEWYPKGKGKGFIEEAKVRCVIHGFHCNMGRVYVHCIADFMFLCSVPF